MTLHDLENAVTSLSAAELAQFRTWFAEFDANAWDQELERDIQTGKLDQLADAALRTHQEGKTQEL